MSGPAFQREFLTFACGTANLCGTLDQPIGAPATTALLIVTGGNEVRTGAWNGHARLSARLAAMGYAVMRFDRRGIGDSEGGNLGYRNSADDIAAARAALLAHVPLARYVVAWGNCDAASALMLGGGHGCDGKLVLHHDALVPFSR